MSNPHPSFAEIALSFRPLLPHHRAMISHCSLGATDLAASAAFYDALFAPLGYERLAGTKENELGYGPPGEGHFWLYAASPSTAPGAGGLASPGTHVAFRAPSREALHSAAEAARARGASFPREPGPHPDISPDYYGAILLGPDGHKLEIVVE